MLTEHFNEGLVLLRRMMNWSMAGLYNLSLCFFDYFGRVLRQRLV